MRLPDDLIEGRLIRRYKRFLADVELATGETITVHCANSGSMKGCSEPGRPVLISDSRNPKRKLRHTLEMIRMGRTWVGVNTANPNRAVAAWIENGRIAELAGYPYQRREVPYGENDRSRIDVLLEDPDGGRPRCWVEIKNTTWRVGEHAAFPDAVTTRGQKHLRELAGVVEQGERGVMFFFVGRADCTRFRPADEIDPDYGRILRSVVEKGVEPIAFRMRFTRQRIELMERIPVDL
ncbi:MAG: DNA/RNA nuclease SfsA [Thermoanaerobaculia bacterium]|nr:DNA/RNA nuclease SfsA [Thermoanaerobaculia bacterium]